MTHERRQFSRVPLPVEAQCRQFGELAESGRTITTINLSAAGMRLRTSNSLVVGDKLEIQIQLPGLPEPLVMRGWIVWSQLQASDVTEAGVAFLDVTPEQQRQMDALIEFLKRNA